MRRGRRISSIGELVDYLLDNRERLAAELSKWKKLVDEGADPIEALHGHKCSPECWHHYEGKKYGRRSDVHRDRH